MHKPHPKYKIQENDTIQSITERFGIEKDVWLRYHNNSCRLSDIIRKDIPSHLEEIFLLPELWDRAILLNQISSLKEQFQPRIYQKDLEQPILLSSWAIYPALRKMNQAYWYRHIIAESSLQTEIRYKILVQFLREQTDETSLLIIDRISDVYINDKLPDLSMEELAYEAGKVFYPLVVEVDKKGNLIGIRNYEQIANRWKKDILPPIQLRYSGKIVNTYLERMGKVIACQSSMEDVLKKDLFFNFYFSTVYRNYSPEFKTEDRILFPIGDYAPITFDTKLELKRELTPKGYKEICHKGIALQKAAMNTDEFIEDQNNTYSANITLETSSNLIKEAVAEWNLDAGSRIIKLILFPLRQKVEKEYKDLIIDKVKKEKSKGLFSTLFG